MSQHVRVEPLGKRLRLVLEGAVVCDSTNAVAVHEGQLPVRYYVPRADVSATISDGQGGGTCPWKGQWRHLDVEVAGRKVRNGGWTYYETTPECAAIRDHVAFYAEKMGGAQID